MGAPGLTADVLSGFSIPGAGKALPHLHMSCGIASAVSASPSDLGGHDAKGRVKKEPPPAGPVQAPHQGLAGGA